MTGAIGTVIGLARRATSGAPLEEIAIGDVTPERGLAGDCKGLKFPNRQLTLLAIEDWQRACDALLPPVALPWTVRRANVLVSGVRLPRARGALVAVGAVRLEVTAQTFPCVKMERAHPGLLKALGPDWRGGVTCKVLVGGHITPGDRIEILHSPPERSPRLPG